MVSPPSPYPAPGLPKSSRVVTEPSLPLRKITSSWGGPCARTAPTEVPPPRRSRPHGGPAPLRGRGWPRGDAVGLWKSSLGPRWSGAPSVGYPSGPHKASLPPSPTHFKEKSPAPPPFHRRCPGCDSAAVGAQKSVLRWLPSPRPGAGPGAHPPRALSGRRLTNLRSLGMVRM